MENIVQKTQQGIANMLVDLKAQRAFHAQALANIDATIGALEHTAKTIGADVAVKTPRTRGKKAADKPAAKKAAKPAAKKAAKPAAKKAAKAASKPTPKAPKKAATPKPKKAAKSTEARLAAANSTKLDPATLIEAAGFSPRIVKFLKASKIVSVADLAMKDIRALAATGERIGEGAIREMQAAVNRAGLVLIESKPNGAVPGANASVHA